ncbi:MAG: sugar phosphate isomerase/epimerase [Verrucomicrobia bacterium]|nr:sugar phosphate isomerase/epimerase [Verrucomicrobiota bacterium]
MNGHRISRRTACQLLTGALAGLVQRPGRAGPSQPSTQPPPAFRLHYLLASSLYGTLPLETILPEVRRTSAEEIDLWPRVHGNQREQVEAMGWERFGALLEEHRVKLGAITRFDLGPFRLEPELKFAQQFGARLIVTGSSGPANATGADLKPAVKAFLEKLKPHVAAAAAAQVTIGIENHANALIASPDSIRYFAELAPPSHLGIALAPYHLPQDPALLAQLIGTLGSKLALFYAWQHGAGASKKLPKEEEMSQMPGYGPLDFKPLLEALRQIQYAGPTSIFMHPVPRGIPILPTATEVTGAINTSRRYLEQCLSQPQTELENV